LAKAVALNFSEQVQKFLRRFTAESAVEKRATISKGGLMVRLLACVVPVVLLFAFFTTIAPAQTAGGNPAPAPAVADQHATSEPFDVNAAVAAYLAKMPPAERARSNAYFEGGYWLLLLWDFLSTVVVMWVMPRFR
jgi:hypothetical protein